MPRGPTTPACRCRVVDNGWLISEVAASFQVSWPTVKRWGRPLSGRCAPRPSFPAEDRRTRRRRSRASACECGCGQGPVQLAARLGDAPSTVHRILTVARVNRLSTSVGPLVSRSAGTSTRPGSLVHVDVKKLGNTHDDETAITAARSSSSRGRVRRHHGGCPVGQRFRVSVTAVAETLVSTCRSSRSSRARTVRRPMGKWSASTARWPTDGRAPAVIALRPSAQCPRTSLHHYNHHRPRTACGNQPPVTRPVSTAKRPAAQTIPEAAPSAHRRALCRGVEVEHVFGVLPVVEAPHRHPHR